MPPSVQSFGARSTTSIATTRSRTLHGSRKVKIHWWERRPILQNAFFIDLQKGSNMASIFTLLESILQICLAIFDIYCLLEAAPGSKHSRNFGISFMFVYSGNQHVRRSLIAISLILLVSAIYLLISSIILMTALRKEHELKFRHWLRAMAVFICLRFISIIYQSIVNDLYFLYHQLMLILWFLLTCINVFTWLVVYSNYQELSDITRLEDMAKLKVSTMSSLNASRTFSHHSLDSNNPYGRYGGGGGGGGSLQPSPQVYHHSMVANTPLTIHESHQNILSPRPGTSGGVGSSGHGQSILPSTPRSHHSSQNSLHASYLQMYSNTLSQRSRQSSQASISMNSMANAFPMHSYSSSQPQSQLQQQQQPHQQQQQQQQQQSNPSTSNNNPANQQSSRLSNFGQTNYGAFGGGYLSRNSNTPM